MTKESPKEFIVNAWGTTLEAAMKDVLTALRVAKAKDEDYEIDKRPLSCRVLFYNSIVHGVFKEYLKTCGWTIEEKSA